jgi:predicted amidophosphoribosyltransferase
MLGFRGERSLEATNDIEWKEMKMGHDAELKCPRCCEDPAKAGGRQTRCSSCGAELVSTRSPTEARVRAYLYEIDDTSDSRPPAVLDL